MSVPPRTSPWPAALLLLPALLILLLLPSDQASAQASKGPRSNGFPTVCSLSGPGEVDWTELMLRTTTESLPEAGAYAARTVVEQRALKRLGPLMLDSAAKVRITAETTAGDIIKSGSRLGALLDEDSSSWRVNETRYFRSGRVEMDGTLDIAQWLKPVLLSLESQDPPPQGVPTEFTGILIDARGLKVEPALAPRIWAPSGELLYSIQLLPSGTCKSRSPVGFVTDPADPRAWRRIGEHPLFVRATSIRDRSDLVLDASDSLRFLTARQDPRILSEARVILVLDPP